MGARAGSPWHEEACLPSRLAGVVGQAATVGQRLRGVAGLAPRCDSLLLAVSCARRLRLTWGQDDDVGTA